MLQWSLFSSSIHIELGQLPFNLFCLKATLALNSMLSNIEIKQRSELWCRIFSLYISERDKTWDLCWQASMQYFALPLLPINCCLQFPRGKCGGIKTLTSELQRYSNLSSGPAWDHTPEALIAQNILGPLNAFISPCPEKGICPLGEDSLPCLCCGFRWFFLWSLSVKLTS